MARKNQRRRSKLEGRLGFNPNKYIKKHRAYEPVTSETAAEAVTPKHYEIWFADLGFHPGTSIQEGTRPVVIISNDIANVRSTTVTVIPITSKQKRLDMRSHVWVENISDEIQYGTILAEQITTISRQALHRCVGKLRERSDIEKLEAAIRVQFDMRQEVSSPCMTEKKEKECEDEWQQKIEHPVSRR